MNKGGAERLPDVESDFEPRPEWLVNIQRDGQRCDVSVAHTSDIHGFRSFGWFSSSKILIEAATEGEKVRRAQAIADLFNREGFGP